MNGEDGLHLGNVSELNKRACENKAYFDGEF